MLLLIALIFKVPQASTQGTPGQKITRETLTLLEAF